MTLTIKSNPDIKEYKLLWEKQQFHLLQGYEWGELKGGLRFIINNDYPLTVHLRKIPLIGGYIAYSHRLNLPAELIKQIIDSPEFKELGIKLWHIDPAWGAAENNSHGFKVKSIQPQYTNIIDVLPVEQMWAKFKPKYRRNVNKAEREGVAVRTFSTIESIDRFYKIMEEVSLRAKFKLMPLNYFRHMQQLYQPKKIAVHLAKYQGEDVGTYLVLFDQNGAYELYGGVTSKGREVEASYMLKTHSLAYAFESGAKTYDQWGVAPFTLNDDGSFAYQSNHSLSQIAKFKEGFGGNNIKFADSFIVSNNPPALSVYKLYSRLRRK